MCLLSLSPEKKLTASCRLRAAEESQCFLHEKLDGLHLVCISRTKSAQMWLVFVSDLAQELQDLLLLVKIE